MAMPSGNVVLSDKMQFPAPAATGAGGGGQIHQHQQRQWFPDERDGFIYWLRGEFAAANAIIDTLCSHLREVSDAGEYDAVGACIQQRRCQWNPVLHMQQFFPVTEISNALQQVVWRRRQRHYDHGKVGGREFRRSGIGFKGHKMMNYGVDNDGNSTLASGEKGSENVKPSGEAGKVEDKGSASPVKDVGSKPHADTSLIKSGSSKGSTTENTEAGTEDVNGGCTLSYKEKDLHTSQNQNGGQNVTGAKSFVCREMFDGKMVNVVDGLKLYKELFDEKEVSNLVSLVNDLRAAGKRGEFQGQIYVASRKPMKGHGREMIQLGLPIADAPLDDEIAAGNSKDRRIEAIPALLQDAIERLVNLQVITSKPDSCIIDVYNEGDHSPPRVLPPWYGKPVCIMFLTEGDITFGRVMASDHPGDFRGSLKLSLVPGSLLVMQGKSADFAKHALPSVRKQRIVVTFTKYQPKKFMPDNQRLPSPYLPQSSKWGPPPSRSPNHFRPSAGPRPYAAVPTTVVLPVPATPNRPQIPSPNGVQTLFVPAPVTPAIPFHASVPVPPGSNGWPAAPTRHLPPRLPVPGTGVFLPQELSTTATEKSNHRNGSLDEKSAKQDCNGSVDGSGNGVAVKEGQ